WLMMSLWDALRMNMMISYQELVRTFLSAFTFGLIEEMDGRLASILDRQQSDVLLKPHKSCLLKSRAKKRCSMICLKSKQWVLCFDGKHDITNTS
ncbi:hypothetical protein, partial [Enterobacter hormaechei]|uniref:hypothetical protein n=1 Tax=Enterobacter hormaechei TaxID=158836 RepID=UPI001C558103